jgi:hypothetical protein
MFNNSLQERSIYKLYYICFLNQCPEKCKEYTRVRLLLVWIEPCNMSTRGYLCGVSMCPILYSSFLIPITFLPCTQSCSLWDKIYKKIKKHNIDWNMNEAKHSKCVNVCRTKAYTVSSLRGKETFWSLILSLSTNYKAYNVVVSLENCKSYIVYYLINYYFVLFFLLIDEIEL